MLHPYPLFGKFYRLAVVFVALWAMVGCSSFPSEPTPTAIATPASRRPFGAIHVYSATPGSVDQYYDAASDTIRGEDVWVFHPNGIYSAVLCVDGKIKRWSGSYSFDGVGDDMMFFIETNGDGNYDVQLYTAEGFPYIEWRRQSGTIRYVRAAELVLAY